MTSYIKKKKFPKKVNRKNYLIKKLEASLSKKKSFYIKTDNKSIKYFSKVVKIYKKS